MFVTSINASNSALFAPLAQKKWFTPIDYPGRYLLGAIGEDEQGKYAAGVLVFEIREGGNGEEDLIAAVLQWLYVAPEFRRRGAADALLQELFRILSKTPVEAVICDLPMGDEYRELCACLENWGFEFTPVNVYELNTTLGALGALPVFQKQPRPHTMALRHAPKQLLNDALRRLENQWFLPDDLYERIPSRDEDLSCVICGKNAAEGLALVCSDGEGGLELLLMRAFSDAQRNSIDLLTFAGRAAMSKYPPETPVRIVCRSEATAGIIHHMIPGAQPFLVLRGISSVFVEDETEQTEET